VNQKNNKLVISTLTVIHRERQELYVYIAEPVHVNDAIASTVIFFRN